MFTLVKSGIYCEISLWKVNLLFFFFLIYKLLKIYLQINISYVCIIYPLTLPSLQQQALALAAASLKLLQLQNIKVVWIKFCLDILQFKSAVLFTKNEITTKGEMKTFYLSGGSCWTHQLNFAMEMTLFRSKLGLKFRSSALA